MKFGTWDLHVMPLSKSEFLENRWSKGLTLCNLVKTFYMYFLQFPEFFIKFGIRNIHKAIFSDSECHGNRCICSHTFLRAINKINGSPPLPSFVAFTEAARMNYESSIVWRLNKLQLDSDFWRQEAIDRWKLITYPSKPVWPLWRREGCSFQAQ